MGLLTSSGGGEDSIQVGIAVMCIVVSLVVTGMVPMLVPEWDADGDLLEETRTKMESFTGESMVSQTPWVLTSVRTPYTAGSMNNVVSEYGWLYGEISEYYKLGDTVYLDPNDEDEDGQTPVNPVTIKLDPAGRSDYALAQTQGIDNPNPEYHWIFSDNIIGDFFWAIGSFIGSTGVWNVDRYSTGSVSAFEFTGLMYHFDSTYRISTQDSSVTKLNSDSGSLNIIWYDDGKDTGISGGLVLRSDKTNAIIANYSALDILDDIELASDHATKYLLNFEGISVYMYIAFDNDVIGAGYSLLDAWYQGKWTIGFVSPSADGLMDMFNSNSLSSSIGNIIDTYLSIFTFNMPNCPIEWNIVFWVMCVLPLEIVMILFLSRFGIAGLGVGILGNALAFLGGL